MCNILADRKKEWCLKCDYLNGKVGLGVECRPEDLYRKETFTTYDRIRLTYVVLIHYRSGFMTHKWCGGDMKLKEEPTDLI